MMPTEYQSQPICQPPTINSDIIGDLPGEQEVYKHFKVWLCNNLCCKSVDSFSCYFQEYILNAQK